MYCTHVDTTDLGGGEREEGGRTLHHIMRLHLCTYCMTYHVRISIMKSMCGHCASRGGRGTLTYVLQIM